MREPPTGHGDLVWATRGRTWGFRFLRRAGLHDPLVLYERAFAGIGDRAEVCHRVAGDVALRFQDPEGRRDQAGRVIPHDFVVRGARGEDLSTVDDGIQRIWPEVADEFARIWDQAEPKQE